MILKSLNTFAQAMALTCLYLILTAYVVPQEHSYIPENGFVPDAPTAIKIAEAVWTPIYGEKTIQKEKPFRAELRDDRWVVTGTMSKHFRFGGVAVAEIAKADGRVLRVSHGK